MANQVSLLSQTHLSRISWQQKCQHGKEQYPRHRHQPVRVGPRIPYDEGSSAEGHQDKEGSERGKVHEPIVTHWAIISLDNGLSAVATFTNMV